MLEDKDAPRRELFYRCINISIGTGYRVLRARRDYQTTASLSGGTVNE